jgi:hypothetical protein
MRTRNKLLMGTAFVLAAAACDGVTAPERADAGPASVQVASVADAGSEATLRHVARSVAMALQEQEVRLAVRDAMRDSPWDVHQISLHAYLESAGGRALLEAAARAAGEAPEVFRARLATLPDLDFYVPSREQRTTWRGGAGVKVVASLSFEGGAVFGFNAAGNPLPDPALERRSAQQPVMLLHPAELRGRRNTPQPLGAGDVIQSPGESEQATSYTWIDPDGTETVVDMRAVAEGRDPRFSVLMSTTNDTTYVDYLWFSFGDAGDDAEVMLKAKFYAPDGSLVGTAQWNNFNLRWETDHYPRTPLIARVMPDSSTARINVEVHEDDCGCFGNGNDVYGNRNYYWTDRGATASIYGNGEQTNLQLGWRFAKAPPRLTSVAVGVGQVFVGESSGAAAYALDQYGWRMPGKSASSWSVSNPAIATVDWSGTVYGHLTGWTYLSATIDGMTGGTSFEVVEQTVGCPSNPGADFCS